MAIAPSRLFLTTLAVLLICAAAPSGVPAPSDITTAKADQSTKTKGRLIAQKYLTAPRGGRLRAQNGVELRVPPRVMRRNGVARIRRLSPGRFDLHISAPWKGTVTVLLPLANAKDPAVGHRVRGRWIVEPMTILNGRARLRVRSLSVFDTDEQKRYAHETILLSYTQFLDRKSDFERNGCRADKPKPGGCQKPSPYNSFDWTDDGCSGREQIGAVSNLYRDLFNKPCQQHDFGYRNFGKGLTLERNEDKRAWIDDRFRTEMKRSCDDNFSRWWQNVNKALCRSDADIVWGAVRHLDDWGKPLPAQSPAPGSGPSPTPGPTPPPPPPLPPPPPPFTQTAHVNIDPNTQAYGGVVNVWSRPARNDFCNATFPTCDPASTPIYQVAHGQMVTAVCVVSNGQRIITGTAANPGYDDRRWIALTTGGYLPNTWWARTWISANLRVC